MAASLYQKIYDDLLTAIQNSQYQNGQRLPTEHELAKQYGVSRITSRKALTMLNDKGLITRHSGIGSIVNLSAVKPTRNSSVPKSIGLIVEGMWSCFGGRLFEGAELAAQGAGYNLILKTSGGDRDREIAAIDSLLQLGVSAILISPVHGKYYNERILKLILDGFPLIFVDRYLSGIDAPHVGSNNAESAVKAVDYLAAKGHREIAFFTTGRDQASTLEERENGYHQGLANNGLPFVSELLFNNLTCVSPVGWTQAVESSLEVLTLFLNQHPRLTAAIASEYSIAEMIRHILENQQRKIDIICFDSPHNDMGDYTFTHISQDEAGIGVAAVKMALQMIDCKPLQATHLHIPATLIEGRSTLSAHRTK